MKSTFLLIIAISCFFIACQSNRYYSQIGYLLGPEKQQFTITIGKDTIIKGKSGMVLRFCPNTFICTENTFVLEVQEVRDRGDAFLLGISTLASDGRLLETESMLYLNAITKDGSVVSIDQNCPIQLEIPVKGRRAGAKWFKGNSTKNGVNWDEIPNGFVNQTNISNLATGQQLFRSLCTPCHCPGLTEYWTGPPLSNITQFRDKNWLQQFTRNSQALIASGDSLSICLWDKWKPAIMTSFPQLSATQIDEIYQFISEESARLDIRLDSSYYLCLPSPKSIKKPEIHPNSDTSAFSTVYYHKPFNRYFAKIYSLGWHNCDLFVDDTTAQPAVVKVNISDFNKYEELLGGILFDQLNANIQLEDYGNGQFETVRDWPVRLPQTPARIVVIGIKDKKWFLSEQQFFVGSSNVFNATMQAISSKEMQAFIATNQFRQPQVEAIKEQCKVSW